jgi:hypothetical protein
MTFSATTNMKGLFEKGSPFINDGLWIINYQLSVISCNICISVETRLCHAESLTKKRNIAKHCNDNSFVILSGAKKPDEIILNNDKSKRLFICIV